MSFRTVKGVYIRTLTSHLAVAHDCYRSVQTALTVSLGGIGGIIASTVYREKDYPRYLPGIRIRLVCWFQEAKI